MLYKRASSAAAQRWNSDVGSGVLSSTLPRGAGLATRGTLRSRPIGTMSTRALAQTSLPNLRGQAHFGLTRSYANIASFHPSTASHLQRLAPHFSQFPVGIPPTMRGCAPSPLAVYEQQLWRGVGRLTLFAAGALRAGVCSPALRRAGLVESSLGRRAGGSASSSSLTVARSPAGASRLITMAGATITNAATTARDFYISFMATLFCLVLF
ncbi:hypothetical protein QOT17_009328 [Balamuthia mandrillaris]